MGEKSEEEVYNMEIADIRKMPRVKKKIRKRAPQPHPLHVVVAAAKATTSTSARSLLTGGCCGCRFPFSPFLPSWQPDQNKLHWLCKYVLNSIIKGLSTMPFGMRWLAKQLAEYSRPSPLPLLLLPMMMMMMDGDASFSSSFFHFVVSSAWCKSGSLSVR